VDCVVCHTGNSLVIVYLKTLLAPCPSPTRSVEMVGPDQSADELRFYCFVMYVCLLFEREFQKWLEATEEKKKKI
jgi:hypothetical protein